MESADDESVSQAGSPKVVSKALGYCLLFTEQNAAQESCRLTGQIALDHLPHNSPYWGDDPLVKRLPGVFVDADDLIRAAHREHGVNPPEFEKAAVVKGTRISRRLRSRQLSLQGDLVSVIN